MKLKLIFFTEFIHIYDPDRYRTSMVVVLMLPAKMFSLFESICLINKQ